jgi:hypothetical protein
MSANPPLDIEALMERIRSEVARRRTSTAPESASESAHHYSPGTLLRFGPSGNAGPYTGSGWSHPEAEFRWTDGEIAELIFVFEKPPGDLVLSFTVHPFLGSGVEAQQVSASWNGVLVGEWSISEAKSYHTLILANISASFPRSLLKFHLPQSFSPLAKYLGSDPRRLGLAFHELVLRPARELGL